MVTSRKTSSSDKALRDARPPREAQPSGAGSDTLPAPLRHSWVEDAVATLTGTFVASIGVFLLHSGGAVTGGTAGLSLLVSYASGWSFAVLFVLVNLPFLALGVWKRGLGFGVRTLLAILLVGAWTELHPLVVEMPRIDSVYAALTGNLLVGISMLILFRHNASMGGLNTLALLAQDVLGWRAGYVQLALDTAVIVAALTVASPAIVLASAAGAALLNLVLIMNHRPGRYLGGVRPS